MNWFVVWLIGNTQLAMAIAVVALILTKLPTYRTNSQLTDSHCSDSHAPNKRERSRDRGWEDLFGRYDALRWNSIAHLLWVFVLIKLLCPPMTWWTASIPVALSPVSSAYNETAWSTIADAHWPLGSRELVENLSASLGVVWIFGSLIAMGWILLTSHRIGKLIEYRGRFSLQANELLRRTIQETNGGGDLPAVWLIDAVTSPMLYSPLQWFSRGDDLILFPRDLWQTLDEKSRSVLLQHEYAHWQRRDSLVRKLEILAVVALWWHPLVWIAKYQIENCEERCCDAMATKTQPHLRRTYAEAILQTLDFLCDQSGQGPGKHPNGMKTRPLATGVGRLPRLENRLRQIMNPATDIHDLEDTEHSSRQKAPLLWARRWWLPMLVVVLLPVSPMLTFNFVQPAPNLESQSFESAEVQSGKKTLRINSEVDMRISARPKR